VTQLQTVEGMVRVPVGTWRVDPIHSSVGFEVKHMMIATVRGRFTEYEGVIEAAEDLADSRVYGSAQVASIDTGDPNRDAHLRSPDFFDAERYPQITFESSHIENVGGPDYRITGDLTIKDETREVTFDGTVQGAAEDPWGNERVGLSVRGAINRTEFGLKWQQKLASGGLLVGEEVSVVLDISAVRDADDAG
jgi:polyisoprenoid-binding protein YceI